MDNTHPRIVREGKTVRAMIVLYCHEQHGTTDALCPGCSELSLYAQGRLDKCPFQEGKTTCAKCPVHCYKPAMRERVREVMRYAGPRMLYRHPVMALMHLADGMRSAPVRVKKKGTEA